MERNMRIVKRALYCTFTVFLVSIPVLVLSSSILSLFHFAILLTAVATLQVVPIGFLCAAVDTDDYPDTEIADADFFIRLQQEAMDNPSRFKRRIRSHLVWGRLYLVLLVLSLAEALVGGILLVDHLELPTLLMYSGTTAAVLLVGLIFRSLFFRPAFPESPGGLVATPSSFPNLHRLVREVRQLLPSPILHHIHIVSGSNCSVQLYSDFFGIHRKNIMEIGIDLLMFLDDDELKALLAHELSHIRHKDTLLGYQSLLSLYRWCIVGQNADSQRFTVRVLLGKYASYQVKALSYFRNAVKQSQEKEADRVAMEAVGKDAAIRLTLKLLAVDSSPGFFVDFSKIDDSSDLPEKPYTLHLDEISSLGQRSGLSDGTVKIEIQEKYSGPGDTHPSVYERLKALGWSGNSDSVLLTPRQVLEPGFEAALSFFDTFTAESMADDYTTYLDTVAYEEEVIENFAPATADGDAYIECGYALFRRGRWQEALELFQGIMHECDDSHGIFENLMIDCRLRLGDESAVRDRIRLTEEHPALIEDAFIELENYINTTGNLELQEKLKDWLEEQAGILREFERELGPLRGRDVLISASMPNNRILAPLRARLYEVPRIKSILLMRKEVRYVPKGPLIIGIDVGFSTTSAKDVQKVKEIFEEYLPQLPFSGLIILTYEQDPRFFTREFLGAKGHLMYNRRQYRKLLKRQAAVPEEERQLKRAEQHQNYKSKLRKVNGRE